MAKPLIQIVDDNDNPIGAVTTEEAHLHGYIQRLSRIMVEDENGNILLQKRSASKGLYPNRWDNSAAGHVDDGETYKQAAFREMQEEIGINEAKLQKIGYYYTSFTADWRKLNQFQTIYKTALPHEINFHLEADEVSEVRWFTKDELINLFKNEPDSMTKGLAEVIRRYYL